VLVIFALVSSSTIIKLVQKGKYMEHIGLSTWQIMLADQSLVSSSPRQLAVESNGTFQNCNVPFASVQL
jgi:hypothetical protein